MAARNFLPRCTALAIRKQCISVKTSSPLSLAQSSVLLALEPSNNSNFSSLISTSDQRTLQNCSKCINYLIFLQTINASKFFLVLVLKLSQPNVLTHRTFPKKVFLRNISELLRVLPIEKLFEFLRKFIVNSSRQ